MGLKNLQFTPPTDQKCMKQFFKTRYINPNDNSEMKVEEYMGFPNEGYSLFTNFVRTGNPIVLRFRHKMDYS